jgi:dihydroneopterin triphosphate diphosphatase
VTRALKTPTSVLVLIHTPALEILLLERASHPGYWQSVTGSQEPAEDLAATALREVEEETGIVGNRQGVTNWQAINRFRIFDEWRHRYGPGITHNTEHVFSLGVPCGIRVKVNPAEHLSYCWLPWQQAAEKCFSWSNREALLQLPRRANSLPSSL